MKFQPGESVVCINDDFKWSRQHYANLIYPVCGRCYVVRRYVVKGRHAAIVLQGLINRRVRYIDGHFREAGFWDERFERAPSIDGIRQAAADVARWLPAPIDQDFTEDEKEDA